MMNTWNIVMPTRLNQSEAVEALAMSLASSFEVAETDAVGQPTSLRSRGSEPSSRAVSVRAAEVEFTRLWAIAVAGDDEDSQVLDLEIQRDLIRAVQAYMEVHDLGYMPPTPAVVWEQFVLDLGVGNHIIPSRKT